MYCCSNLKVFSCAFPISDGSIRIDNGNCKLWRRGRPNKPENGEVSIIIIFPAFSCRIKIDYRPSSQEAFSVIIVNIQPKNIYQTLWDHHSLLNSECPWSMEMLMEASFLFLFLFWRTWRANAHLFFINGLKQYNRSYSTERIRPQGPDSLLHSIFTLLWLLALRRGFQREIRMHDAGEGRLL